MAKRTKELTPIKAVLIYSLALVLVVFYELPRVLSWVEDTRWKLTSGQIFDSFAANQITPVSKVLDPTEKTDQAPDDPLLCSLTSLQSSDQSVAPLLKGRAHIVDSRLERLFGSMESPPHRLLVALPHPGSAGNAGNHQSAQRLTGQETSAEGISSPKLRPHKVLLVGDSMIAEGFGPALQRDLRKRTSIEVIRKGQYSTGFIHQEDFNWTSTLKEFIQKYEPDMIVVHMGTNDPIDIVEDSGKRLYCANDRWKEVYASRVGEFLKVASEKKILSFWVGLPIMSSDKYCAKIGVINSIVKQECAKVSGCVYVDTWPVLTDQKGNFTAYIKGQGGKLTRIRAKDNVHLTEAGGEILAEYFLRTACAYVDLSAGDEAGRAKQ